MKRTKRLLSTLLALCMVLAMLPATAMASGREQINRWTVLVLDHSGSMRNDPIEQLKKAASTFCDEVERDSNINHVAIVGFSTTPDTLGRNPVGDNAVFTADMNVAKQQINNLRADGMTDMAAALQEAKRLLDGVSSANMKDVKNIVLLSDGLPEVEEVAYNYTLQNTYAAKGPYLASGYSLEDYFLGSANYTHEKFTDYGFVPSGHKTMYNIYAIGFFHRLSAERQKLCKEILMSVQNKGFYEVANTSDLEFVLGGVVADEILDVKEPGAPEGTSFDPNTTPRVTITIACPVDVTVTPRNSLNPVLDSRDTTKLNCAYGEMNVESAAGTKTITLDAEYRYDIKVIAQEGAPATFPVHIKAVHSSSPTNPVYDETVEMKKAAQAMSVYVRAGGMSVAPVIPYDPITTPDGEDVTDIPSHFTFVPTVTGGTVVLSKRNAEPGDWVNVYVTPDEGYKLESLTVTDMRGWPVTLREMGENAFSFTMPNARINVNPVFVKVEADDDPYSTNVPTNIPNIEGTSPNYGNMVINTAAMNYSDVNAGDWFYNNVKFCHERYLLNKTGEADGKFEPNTASTRATVWTALSRLAGRNTVTQGDNWYDRAQIWAKGKGITDGERPMDSMTREEFVTMLWRYDGNKYVQNSALGQFNDGESVSWWATEAVKWAVATGLLNGSNGSLNPQSNVTRAEVAAVLQRYVQNVH